MPSPTTTSPILKKIYAKGYRSALAGEEYNNPYLTGYCSRTTSSNFVQVNARHYAQGYRDGVADRIMGRIEQLVVEVVYYL